MTVFTVGKASIARIEETYGPTYRARDIFPEFDDRILAEHAGWLAPNHYDAASGFIKLSVHSWLLQIGGQNDPDRRLLRQQQDQAWAAVLEPAQYAMARAARRRGRAAGRDRLRHVHAPASRSRRLEHLAARRKVGADISQCAIRVFEARLRILSPARLRPEQRAGGVRHLPRMRAAGGGGRARRSRHRAAPPQ